MLQKVAFLLIYNVVDTLVNAWLWRVSDPDMHKSVIEK